MDGKKNESKEKETDFSEADHKSSPDQRPNTPSDPVAAAERDSDSERCQLDEVIKTLSEMDVVTADSQAQSKHEVECTAVSDDKKETGYECVVIMFTGYLCRIFGLRPVAVWLLLKFEAAGVCITRFHPKRRFAK